MADLSDLNAALTVKLAGASPSGAETEFIGASNSQLKTSDIINTAALQANKSVSTSAVLASVGSGNLVDRKLLILFTNEKDVTFGFSGSSQPFPLPKGAIFPLDIGDNINVYIKKNSGTGEVFIAELS